MMFSVSETGKIEKLLSISITDLKGSGSMNRIKKPKNNKAIHFLPNRLSDMTNGWKNQGKGGARWKIHLRKYSES